MFTGIVERTAKILSVKQNEMYRRLTLPALWNDVSHGDSIAINGVCLTVAELGEGVLGFDVIAETLDKTNLGRLNAGDFVNLERALRAGDRLDGHFVQGHVDGTAPILEPGWRQPDTCRGKGSAV
jgi:riboflavin synthase